MKQERKERLLFDAVSGIDQALIDEAATAPARSVSVILRRIVATAAALAILVGCWLFWPVEDEQSGGILAVPGVLRAYACDLDSANLEDLSDCELTESRDFYQMIWCAYLSGNFTSTLSFQIEEDYYSSAEITFDITSGFEGFFQKVNLKNGESIRFASRTLSKVLNQISADVGSDGDFYLDLIIRADGVIVGYGVVSFCFSDLCAYAYEFHTVCFPMVDGEYQDISEEYVLNQIAQYKQAKAPGEGAATIRQLKLNAEERKNG